MDLLRQNIKNIQNNNNLSTEEKGKEIQKLMNNASFASSASSDSSDINTIKKCEHYSYKKCDKFYFSCCNKFINCVRCHNEIDHKPTNHKPILKYITCTKCNLLQKPSNKCENNECNIFFSKYYCDICSIWTDKNIIHCIDCGICRIGDKDSLFHCNSCETCFNGSKESHICINKSYKEQICSYCLENIYDAQDSSISLKCNHIVHNKCLQNATKSKCYTCPTCRKSIYDIDWSSLKYLINIQPMINELFVGDIVKCNVFGNLDFQINSIENNMYKGIFVGTYIHGIFNDKSLIKEPKRVDIYCNDCNKTSNVLFHYLGHECIHCESFNTSL